MLPSLSVAAWTALNGIATLFSPMPRKPPTPTTTASIWPFSPSLQNEAGETMFNVHGSGKRFSADSGPGDGLANELANVCGGPIRPGMPQADGWEEARNGADEDGGG